LPDGGCIKSLSIRLLSDGNRTERRRLREKADGDALLTAVCLGAHGHRVITACCCLRANGNGSEAGSGRLATRIAEQDAGIAGVASGQRGRRKRDRNCGAARQQHNAMPPHAACDLGGQGSLGIVCQPIRQGNATGDGIV
jgi:hypothetical protein